MTDSSPPRFLWSISRRTLRSTAEVLITGDDEVLPPEAVVENVDGYLARLESGGKWRIQLALVALWIWPVFRLHRPLPLMPANARKRYLERRFIAAVEERHVWRPVRTLTQVMIRMASQFSYLGYYGDAWTWESVGYTRFRERPGGREPSDADHPAPPLKVLASPQEASGPYDTIIVGSGAAGAILAYRGAESGRRVLVVERGPHVDPRAFTDDEVEQYLLLYNEGAFQLAADFRLQVLQGMCVGGGTTVNNALCLSPPTKILEQWAKRGLDGELLERSITEVSDWLDVAPIRASAFGSVTQRFTRAVETLQLPGRVEVMSANIASNCVGCGYCNIGCAYGAKLSMLETVLPWAQQKFGDRIEVLPDFEVTELVTSGANAVGLRGTHRGTGSRVTLTAKEHVIVAAGAIHSSCLLQRSDIKLRTIGRGVHFNINSPLTAEFEDTVDSFAGIQMSHVYVPEDDGDLPPFLIETWFNPPATQALAMPGWFDQHFTNMRRYRYMASGAALVGTSSPGRVKWTRFGPKITYRPSPQDLKAVVDGLKLTGRIFFEAGAIRVMPATHGWHAFTSPKELDGLDPIVRDNTDLLLSTAHPQGGNPLGTPAEGGVVGADFRVHGFENLYVCDASVFPSSVHVNPQLTVMGLAQYASQRIFA